MSLSLKDHIVRRDIDKRGLLNCDIIKEKDMNKIHPLLKDFILALLIFTAATLIFDYFKGEPNLIEKGQFLQKILLPVFIYMIFDVLYYFYKRDKERDSQNQEL